MMGNIKQILADDTITDEKKIFLIAKLLADRDEDLDDEDLDEVESDRLPKTELQKKLGEARVMARRMRDSGQLLEDLRGGTGSGAHSGSGSGFTMY